MIESKTFGSGERVFLGIHGWGGGHQTFEPFEKYIPDNARLIAIDLPGYGNSTPLVNWRFDELADALVDWFDQQELTDVTLVGNCSGAVFGLLLVKARPKAFEHLILFDVFGFFPWYFKLLTAGALGEFFYSMSFANPIGRAITNGSLSKKRTDDTDLTASFAELDHTVVYAYLKMLRQIPDYHYFADIEIPIDLTFGKNTFAAVRDSVPLWHSVWPQMLQHELAGVGHLPIQEGLEQLVDICFKSRK